MDSPPPRFGSDHGALHSEDEPLVTGSGHFTDDLHQPGQAYAVFVRAQAAHAIIEGVDAEGARTMPGVLSVLTGNDLLRAGIGGIPPVASAAGRDGRPMVAAPMPVLATDRVRYVGEPLAIVVAETLFQAQDAAEAVRAELRRLESASDVKHATAPSAAALHARATGNIALDWSDGDIAAVDAAFAKAIHIERVRLADTRLAPVSMEPRAGIGMWDEKSQRYTLIASTQGVAVVRKLLAESVFKVPLSSIRVLTQMSAAASG
jgi:carbon-monoxide dehydrogenase large subunit